MKHLLVLLVLGSLLHAQVGTSVPRLTSDDVIKMLEAHIDPGIIVKVIRSSASAFDTSTEGLQRLRKAGASQQIVDAMLVSKGVQTQQTLQLARSERLARQGELLARSHSLSEQCSISTLSLCPSSGCAQAGTDRAVFNETKRHIPAESQPISLKLPDDFMSLQQQATDLVGFGGDIPVESRRRLKNLRTSGGSIGEGSLVRVVGYLVGNPLPAYPGMQESANCNLLGEANNDFHIPLAAHPNKNAYEGIVVKMIPQDRDSHPGWDISTLHRVMKMEREVLVEGQLFYDNEHVPSPNPDDPIPGQPPRLSLWEIHPVTEFLVCSKDDGCNPEKRSEWGELSAIKTQVNH